MGSGRDGLPQVAGYLTLGDSGSRTVAQGGEPDRGGAGAVPSGLVALHLKVTLWDQWVTLCGNRPVLGGAVPPGSEHQTQDTVPAVHPSPTSAPLVASVAQGGPGSGSGWEPARSPDRP